jgi:hypothetical protein
MVSQGGYLMIGDGRGLVLQPFNLSSFNIYGKDGRTCIVRGAAEEIEPIPVVVMSTGV